MNQQEESGVFRGHKQYVLPFKTSSFVSDYYPGEAIYALTYYYECSKNSHKMVLFHDLWFYMEIFVF